MGYLLGGVLTDGLTWRWIFFVNVPVGIIVTLLAPRFIGESRADDSLRRFDVAGALSVTAGLSLLIYATTYAADHGWGSTGTIVRIAASVGLLVSFVGIELRSQAPLLPMRLFGSRTLAGSNLAGLVNAGSAFLGGFLPTLYMQQVLGYSAVTTGAAFIATSLATVVTASVVQSVVGRIGVRPIIVGGLLVAAGGMALLARVPADGTYWTDLFPGLVVNGIGIGLVYVATQVGAQMGVRPSDAGVASGLIQTTGFVGGAIAIAVATAIASASTHAYSVAHPGAPSSVAVTHGFQTAFWVFAAVTAAGAGLSAWALGRRRREEHNPSVEPVLVS
jgi:MFS family permease